MPRPTRFSPEVRTRAVRMVLEHEAAHESQWAAITSIAEKIGCTAETLRKWVRQAERDQGTRPGLTTEERQRLKQLERDATGAPGFTRSSGSAGAGRVASVWRGSCWCAGWPPGAACGFGSRRSRSICFPSPPTFWRGNSSVRTGPGVGHRHHLHSDGRGVALSGGDPRSLFAPRRRLGDERAHHGRPHARRAQDGPGAPAPAAGAAPSFRSRQSVTPAATTSASWRSTGSCAA